ncbi:unnamed protein product [Amoebophrya sp. A25]|nr:unnamed protein product [Amoebophrya sp. A25]|eukprot:GSA25T00019602001.1
MKVSGELCQQEVASQMPVHLGILALQSMITSSRNYNLSHHQDQHQRHDVDTQQRRSEHGHSANYKETKKVFRRLRALETCSAPGSKTCQLLDTLANDVRHQSDFLLVANDVDRSRCEQVWHRCAQLHPELVKNLVVTCADAASSDFSRFTSYEKKLQNADASAPVPDCRPEKEEVKGRDQGRSFDHEEHPTRGTRSGALFDLILCDVPCSGDGTIRKNPKKLHAWTSRHAKTNKPLQKSILRNALTHLAPGGVLVYSTCSLNPIENDQVVLEVLAEANGMQEELEKSGLLDLFGEPLPYPDKLLDAFSDAPAWEFSLLREARDEGGGEKHANLEGARCSMVAGTGEPHLSLGSSAARSPDVESFNSRAKAEEDSCTASSSSCDIMFATPGRAGFAILPGEESGGFFIATIVRRRDMQPEEVADVKPIQHQTETTYRTRKVTLKQGDAAKIECCMPSSDCNDAERHRTFHMDEVMHQRNHTRNKDDGVVRATRFLRRNLSPVASTLVAVSNCVWEFLVAVSSFGGSSPVFSKSKSCLSIVGFGVPVGFLRTTHRQTEGRRVVFSQEGAALLYHYLMKKQPIWDHSAAENGVHQKPLLYSMEAKTFLTAYKILGWSCLEFSLDDVSAIDTSEDRSSHPCSQNHRISPVCCFSSCSGAAEERGSRTQQRPRAEETSQTLFKDEEESAVARPILIRVEDFVLSCQLLGDRSIVPVGRPQLLHRMAQLLEKQRLLKVKQSTEQKMTA